MLKTESVWATASELASAIRNREISAAEAMQAVLERVASFDSKLGAFFTVAGEHALEQAAAADRKLAGGEPVGPLHGVPISIKDIIYTAGIRTTGGSCIFENFVPDADAIAVTRLKQAGAIVFGKTATPEFCHKTVTDSPVFGRTRNPWDLTRTTGGSSGGSAAAVAAGLGALSIGTDGGGSIRLPAALCGVVGFKPTAGRVPQFPGFPGWDFLGHTGPLARSVADIKLAMGILAGPDVRDPESLTAPSLPAPHRGVRHLRVAVASSLNHLEPEADVASGLAFIQRAAQSLVGSISEVRPSWTDPDLQFRIIVATELASAIGSHLGEFESRMDQTLVKMLQFGASRRATELVRALEWRRSFARQVLQWFEDYDVLLVPASPVAAFSADLIGPTTIAGRTVSPYDWFGWTWPFNLTGQPALSLPVWGAGALPVGIQIVAKPGADDLVLSFAAALEDRLGTIRMRRCPNLSDVSFSSTPKP